MLTIYKASAGSGKTYTLALEYIKILLGIKNQESGRYRLNHRDFGPNGSVEPDRHRGILAVTFTNKATEEMKSRIIKELSDLAHIPTPGAKDANYAEALTKEFGCSRSQLAEAATDALHRLLNDYGNFNVSTIDAFFQGVLRTFAREVDCRGDYEVELNDDLVMTTGVGLMLDDLNYGRPKNRQRMMNWISDFTFEQVDSGSAFNVFNRSSRLIGSLTKYVKTITGEDFKKYSAATLEYFERDPGLATFRRNLRSSIEACIAERTEACAAISTLLSAHGRTTEVLNRSLRTFIDDASQSDLPLSAIKKLAAKESTGFASTAMAPSENAKMTNVFVAAAMKGVGGSWPWMQVAIEMSGHVAAIFSALRRNCMLVNVLQTCDSLEFLGFVWNYVDAFRRENNLILLSDTTDLIRRIINGSDAPFIYERMGMRLRNFLIDEFQDTSHMQWENLRPLVANSLASGHDSLIIGDEKQSIYRFRNSDSSLLHHRVAREDFPDKNLPRGTKPEENTNYRSSHTVVRFNNTLFRHLGANLGEDTYDNVTQGLPDSTADLSGYVCITDTSDLPKVNDCHAALDLTAQAIIAQHEAGYRWSDIAVLVRKRDDAATILSYFMEHYPEIRFSSDETLLLRNSPAVRLVISLMKLLDSLYSPESTVQPDPDTPRYGTRADALLMMSRFEYHMSRLESSVDPDLSGQSRSGRAITTALDSNDHWNELVMKQVEDIRRANPTNLVALVETIIQLKVPREQHAAEMPYLSALVDAVSDYCRIYNPSLSAFLHWWDESADKLTLLAATKADAINVLTIHKAKGLEWPCVHIPFAGWEMKREPEMWFDMADFESISPGMYPPAMMLTGSANMAPFPTLNAQRLSDIKAQQTDNLNLLYVALTRAGRELHVCFDSKASRDMAEMLSAALMQPLSPDEATNPLLCHIPQLPDDPANPAKRWVLGEPTVPGEAGKPKESSGTVRKCPPYTVTHRPDTTPMAHIEGALSLRAVAADALDLGNETANLPVDPESDPRSELTRRGIWLHGVLADMPTLSDFPAAFATAMTRHPLPPDTATDYRRMLLEAFEAVPQWRDRWFVDHIVALDEQSIYDPERNETYRPDRIVRTADGALEVVDYKFTSGQHPDHILQVRRYVHLLRRMGHPNVSGYLWYPAQALILPAN